MTVISDLLIKNMVSKHIFSVKGLKTAKHFCAGPPKIESCERSRKHGFLAPAYGH